MDKKYSYRPGRNETWEVLGTFPNGDEDWVADVSTETVASNLVVQLSQEEPLAHRRYGEQSKKGGCREYISTQTPSNKWQVFGAKGMLVATFEHENPAKIYLEQIKPALVEPEEYRCIAVSTCHLSDEDMDALTALTKDDDCNMVMERDTGYFIKLYEEVEYNTYEGCSPILHQIVQECHAGGFRMIEFDSDVRACLALPMPEEV